MPADDAAYVAIANASYPDHGWTVEELRYDDGTWDHATHFKARLVAEERGQVVGIGELQHDRWTFVPDKYRIDAVVHPHHRGRGHGSALYDTALAIARGRTASVLYAGAKESMADGVRFLERRGFREVKRDWESRLKVKDFDFSRFASAHERIARAGISIRTLAEEMARDPKAVRKAYELSDEVEKDVPSIDPPTSIPYKLWRAIVLEGPTALADAFFVAVSRDGRYVGLSNMHRSIEDPTLLWQHLTAVRREERGKGIAMALKLRTVRYARQRGVDHIKTMNDARNRAMLAINDALGFEKQPVWIAYQKDLGPQ